MNLKIKEITDCLEDFAPKNLQEAYDNSGLNIGNPEASIDKALLCLDCTEEVLAEAIQLNCKLIIAHHPLIFTGIKSINGKNATERIIIRAIQNDIAIYAAHTNMDNVWNGVNHKIAQKLGLKNCRVLGPKKGFLKKLITFCPNEQAEKVRLAIFQAGAGVIGEYDQCSFNATGTGTFRPSENSNPFSGEKNKLQLEPETRIETIYPVYLEKKILQALFEAHPYEEVAYDLVPLDNLHPRMGSGLVGELEQELDEKEFLQRLKKNMEADCVRHTAFLNQRIKKVAVCGGSGSFLLQEAIGSGARVFVTADFKYHQFFDADGKILIADIGHFETEHFTKELFYEIIQNKFPKFALHLSKINTNPINYF